MCRWKIMEFFIRDAARITEEDGRESSEFSPEIPWCRGCHLRNGSCAPGFWDCSACQTCKVLNSTQSETMRKQVGFGARTSNLFKRVADIFPALGVFCYPRRNPSRMRLAFLLHSLGLLAFFVSPSVSTSAQLFSSWTEIRASGPSPGYRTGHVGVPDHGSDAALFFAGHDGEYNAFSDVWRFSFHGKFWEKLSVRASSSAPPARYDHCGASCSSKFGSRALFFGGASANSSLLNDVWTLKLNADSSWVQLNPSSRSSPSPRRNSACVCLGVSYFLVFGGRDIRGAVSDLWIMNLDSNAWNLLTSSSALAPGPLFASCMHTLSSTKAFVFGGINSKNVASSGAWVLDVAANNSSTPQVQPSSAQWEQLNLKPNLQARGFHSCIGPPVSITDRSADLIYIRGGIGSGESRNDNILDDFQSCRVIAKGLVSELHCRPALFTSALPLCSECISVMVSNIVLVHGGLGRGAEISGKTALLYLSDMRVENVFNPGEPAPVARSGAVIEHFTHVEDNQYIFLHGGIDSQDDLLSDTWLFKVSTAKYDFFLNRMVCHAQCNVITIFL